MSALILAFDPNRPRTSATFAREFAMLSQRSQAWILDLIASLRESEAEQKGEA